MTSYASPEDRQARLAELLAIDDWVERHIAVAELGRSGDPSRIALALDIALGRIEAPGLMSAADEGLVDGHVDTIDRIIALWEEEPTGVIAQRVGGLLGEIAFKMRPDPDPRIADAALRHAERLVDGPHAELEGPLYVMREFGRSKPRREFARFARAYIEAVRSTEDDEAYAIGSAFGILLDLDGPAFIEALGQQIEPLPVGHFFREHVEIFVNEAFRIGVRPYGPK